MQLLPTVHDKVVPHQGTYIKKRAHFIPSLTHADFWSELYDRIHSEGKFQLPLQKVDFDSAINPYFGYFGYRRDLEHLSEKTFHVGIDIESQSKTKVFPIADGKLEYSGYGLINGKYVMLSHPQFMTEDGFILHSLYMHLARVDFGFTSYQKMLRQISLSSYPVIRVEKESCLGSIGTSGFSAYPKGYVHLHLQTDFIHKDGTVIHVDPSQLLGLSRQVNITSETSSDKQFFDVYLKNRKDIYERKLQHIWKDASEKGMGPRDRVFDSVDDIHEIYSEINKSQPDI